jgi:hypothetical protein
LLPTAQHGVVTYRTGLQVDIDGAANAYSVDGALGSATNGGALDHICSGANDLAVQQGRLRNKYPHLDHPASAKCLADYKRLRDAGFPACSSGECMRFYGVVSTKRPCAVKGDTNDKWCGEPIRQKDGNGNESAFYVSATSYQRKGAAAEDQSGYPDARYVPYLVYDSARLLKFNLKVGDLALIAWKGRATFAVYGDSGSHLCEASLATHNRLYGKPDADWVNWLTLGVPSGAEVVAFPDSAKFLTTFPAVRPGVPTPGQQIYDSGVQAITAAGGPAILNLVGLTSMDAISKE